MTSRPSNLALSTPGARRSARVALAVLGVLFAAGARAAVSPRDGLVVDAGWLTQHVSDPDLVLLHVGDKKEYEASHIPGARHVSLRDVSVSDQSATGLILEMPPAEDLRGRLETLGISDSSRVVVYFGKDWISPATRILFTLDYAGLGARASLLDGGMGAWVKKGGKVTAEVPAATKGKLSPLRIKPIVVDAATVRAKLGTSGVSVVDGRSASFYDGADTGGSDEQKHRTGHIRGALSIPFGSIADDSLMLLAPADMAALFSKAGVKEGDTVIGYCHIGQQATAMLFAARTLGHPVLLYDGSFQDWSRHADYPVDNPAEKGEKTAKESGK